MATNDLTGERFEMLVVEERVRRENRSGRTVWVWRCRCDCGKTREVITATWNRGHARSCGCHVGATRQRIIKSLSGKNSKLRKGFEDITGSVWRRILETSAHRKKRVPFTVTIEDVWSLFVQQNRKCAITGVDLYFAQTTFELENGLNTASLDRIDSDKGYELGNVQWVHTIVNRLKWDMPQDKFIKWCKLVADNN